MDLYYKLKPLEDAAEIFQYVNKDECPIIIRHKDLMERFPQDISILSSAYPCWNSDIISMEKEKTEKIWSESDPPGAQYLYQELVSMGFSSDQVISALRSSNFDLKTAIAILSKPETQDLSALSSYNFGDYQDAISDFTDNEKMSLIRLLHEFPADPSNVVITFISCDKNEESTKASLT